MHRRLLFAALVLALGLPAAAHAERDSDHDEALRAVQSGQILPLNRLLDIAQREVPGEVVDVDLEHDDGRLEYEIEILGQNGRVRTVTLDARTGAVLEVEDDD
jgi:uncharacterized membrane protein YkoI